MLEHQALRAVVIERMRRTARDRRWIAVIIVIGRFTGMVMSCHMGSVEIEDDPRQRPERRPGKGDERARRDPVAPAAGATTRTMRSKGCEKAGAHWLSHEASVEAQSADSIAPGSSNLHARHCAAYPRRSIMPRW